MRLILALIFFCGLAYAGDAKPIIRPAHAPAYEAQAPDSAKKAFAAMDDAREAIESGNGAAAHEASAKFRELQRACLTEYFTDEDKRKPLPESAGKDARDFNEAIGADWTDEKSPAPQKAGYAFGHYKHIEWLMELCDGAPHRYGNKTREEMDADKAAKGKDQKPAPALKRH